MPNKKGLCKSKNKLVEIIIKFCAGVSVSLRVPGRQPHPPGGDDQQDQCRPPPAHGQQAELPGLGPATRGRQSRPCRHCRLAAALQRPRGRV